MPDDVLGTEPGLHEDDLLAAADGVGGDLGDLVEVVAGRLASGDHDHVPGAPATLDPE